MERRVRIVEVVVVGAGVAVGTGRTGYSGGGAGGRMQEGCRERGCCRRRVSEGASGACCLAGFLVRGFAGGVSFFAGFGAGVAVAVAVAVPVVVVSGVGLGRSASLPLDPRVSKTPTLAPAALHSCTALAAWSRNRSSSSGLRQNGSGGAGGGGSMRPA